jgi:transcriptional regulator with PAS, ATPase and Fis domain
MKKIRFSVYILVPLIFAGLTIFTGLAVYRTTIYLAYLPKQDNTWAINLVITGIAFLAFFVSFLILRVLLKPLKRFDETTANLPILVTENHDPGENEQQGEKEIVYYSRILEQASNLLGKVEAKELFPEILGQSRAIREIMGQVLKVARTDTTVLLMGESGTGKELISRAIYNHGTRQGKPFVILNCVAIPEGLFESELFGHEKGSFTGAISRKIGKMELANGGTMFFDEIGDMPLNAQAKLLRVLQEHKLERVGGTTPVEINVRIIAATNKDLVQMVKAGTFREDLFYRLNVFTINLPALRDRREDILSLVPHFLAQAGKTDQISDRALQVLTGYAWPGNIRELKNCLERAAVLSGNDQIEPGHLPDYVMGSISNTEALTEYEKDQNLDERIRMVEKGLILHALKKTKGVQSKAAELLGINQRSLWHRVKKHNIDLTALRK